MFAGISLLIAVCLFRLLPIFKGVTVDQPDWLYNFSPITALCLCGAACFPRKMALTLPLAALIGTDMILSSYYGWPIFNAEFLAKTVVFAAVVAFGWQLRANPRLRVLLPAAVGSSIFFYLITNSVSWLFDPGYVKNMGGWVQALTTGLPGYAPTWSFYKNTLLSDVLFTLIFVASVRMAKRAPADEPVMVAPARW